MYLFLKALAIKVYWSCQLSKILAVDDSNEVISLIAELFADQHMIITASNGKKAVEAAFSEMPDLIIMDINMPVMDGLQATRILKEDPRTMNIPIIMLTALDSDDDLVMGLNAGACDYLGKPFHRTVLEAKVNAQLRTKALYDSLEHANQRLMELDRLKSGFIAMAAHELKTPLNVINNYMHMLLEGVDGPLNTQQAEILALALESSTDLVRIVDEMLDLSVLESGRVSLDIEECDMLEVIKWVITLMKGEFDKKGIRVIAAVGKNMGFFDRKRVRQILINLLRNAIKFTSSGGEVAVSVEDGESGLKVTVSDTGKGIPKNEIERVFDEFYKGKSGEDGAGLGLSICKKIVEIHGGRMWAESEEGKGSIFYFTLPRKQGLAKP